MENSPNLQQPEPPRERWKLVLGYAIVMIVALVSYFAGYSLFGHKEPPQTEHPDVIETPDKEAPHSSSSASGTVIMMPPVDLLENPYKPPANPFDSEQYDATTPRMVLSGSFLKIVLYAHGNVIGDGSRFLILNVNGESGIVNATRKSQTRLDIDKTTTSGGVFTQDNAISVVLGLIDQVLGTTGVEFSQTGEGIRHFHFVKSVMPVEVIPLIVIPFKNDGTYGGAVIDTLRIEYQCMDGKQCKIAPCSLSKLYTQCIKDEFGEKGMKDWQRRHPQKK